MELTTSLPIGGSKLSSYSRQLSYSVRTFRAKSQSRSDLSKEATPAEDSRLIHSALGHWEVEVRLNINAVPKGLDGFKIDIIQRYV